jgi:flagellar biosynthesis protein FlhB
MADDAQDKQLPATERKIRKAREEGQVARSRDLGHFTALGVGLAILGAFAPELNAWLTRLVAQGLRFDAATIAHPQGMVEHMADLALQMLVLLLPLGVLMALLALAAGLLAGGWNFSMKAMEPKFEKMNPLAGIKRIFSGDNLIQTLKACGLALVLGGVATLYLALRWSEYTALQAMPLPTALAGGGGLVQVGLLAIAAVLGVFALVDVPLQRHLLLKRLRMSVVELKKELKETEGSPEVKGRIKSKMREMAGRRMLAAVPLADLVVMNPTHFAVALKYDPEGGAAPRVVAKGADLLAFRIRDLAKEHRVPVLQAPPLARALYTHCELEQEIPARLFAAVAQVLAWVYQLRDALAAGRPLDLPPPEVQVPPDMDPQNPAARRPGRRPGATNPGATTPPDA